MDAQQPVQQDLGALAVMAFPGSHRHQHPRKGDFPFFPRMPGSILTPAGEEQAVFELCAAGGSEFTGNGCRLCLKRSISIGFFSSSIRGLLLCGWHSAGIEHCHQEKGAGHRINKNMAVRSWLSILQSCRERGAWGSDVGTRIGKIIANVGESG